jgi:hypothetical protein
VRTVLIVAGGVIVVLLIAAQLLLPGLVERDIEDRLTEGGGEAQVTVSAVPAARLLFDDGDQFEVAASGLDLDLDERIEVFERLDGFGEVDIAVTDTEAGPFAVESFALTREASGPYRLVSTSTTTAADLADYSADILGLAGPLAGIALDEVFARADAPIPIELDMELTSDEGRIEVVRGGGTIAGFPAGPLAELITAAILVRL